MPVAALPQLPMTLSVEIVSGEGVDVTYIDEVGQRRKYRTAADDGYWAKVDAFVSSLGLRVVGNYRGIEDSPFTWPSRYWARVGPA